MGLKFSSPTVIRATEPELRSSTVSASVSTSLYPPFSYSQHTTPDGQQVTVHLCEDLASFEQALLHLEGETLLGIDVEHQPFERRKKKASICKEREVVVQYERDASLAAHKVLQDHMNDKPGMVPELVIKSVIPSGIKWPDGTYLRLAQHTKAMVSVIQLASASHIIVAHLARFPTSNEITVPADFVPSTLRTIMCDDKIIKVGLSLTGEGGDAHNCSRYLNLPSQGLIELRDLDNIIRPQEDEVKTFFRLSQLCEFYLGQTLLGKKGNGDITVSNWHIDRRLSQEQIDYAANDAYAGVKLYNVMMQKLEAMNPKPKAPRLHSQVAFDWVDWRDKKLSELLTENTAASKRRAKGLGWVPPHPDPEPKVAANSPSKATKASKIAEGRAEMASDDSILLASMINHRKEIIEKLQRKAGVYNYHHVIKDGLIDKIATTKPRPQSVEELQKILPEGAWKNFGQHAESFLQLIRQTRHEEPVANGDRVEDGKGELL